MQLVYSTAPANWTVDNLYHLLIACIEKIQKMNIIPSKICFSTWDYRIYVSTKVLFLKLNVTRNQFLAEYIWSEFRIFLLIGWLTKEK